MQEPRTSSISKQIINKTREKKIRSFLVGELEFFTCMPFLATSTYKVFLDIAHSIGSGDCEDVKEQRVEWQIEAERQRA